MSFAFNCNLIGASLEYSMFFELSSLPNNQLKKRMLYELYGRDIEYKSLNLPYNPQEEISRPRVSSTSMDPNYFGTALSLRLMILLISLLHFVIFVIFKQSPLFSNNLQIYCPTGCCKPTARRYKR